MQRRSDISALRHDGDEMDCAPTIGLRARLARARILTAQQGSIRTAALRCACRAFHRAVLLPVQPVVDSSVAICQRKALLLLLTVLAVA